jgi:hypothetical protein
VTELAGAFPDASTQHLGLYSLESYLPSWERASALCALYLAQAPWFFGAVKERQLQEELLPLFYGEADARSPHAAGTLAAATPHDLALLFVILCYGSLVDESLPPAPENAEAERFYLLTRAALALDPVTDQSPSVSTVQALSLMAIYQGLVANENSIESTWILFGMATKLAQSVRLAPFLLCALLVRRRAADMRACRSASTAIAHAGSSRRPRCRSAACFSGSYSSRTAGRCVPFPLSLCPLHLRIRLIPACAPQGLATGRLGTFALPFVDCELPQDTEQILADDGTPDESCTSPPARAPRALTLTCASPVLEGALRQAMCLGGRAGHPDCAPAALRAHRRARPDRARHGAAALRAGAAAARRVAAPDDGAPDATQLPPL